VQKGERVRLRFIKASADHTHVLRLAGHRLRVTHTDGNPLIEGVEVDALTIAPSERYDVLVVANRPGAWFLQCVQPGHAEAGERTALLYEGSKGATPEWVAQGIAGLVLWNYALGQGRDVLRRAAGPARAFNQTLSGGMMGSDRWTINGKRRPLLLRLGGDAVHCGQ
jgi:multicopper oxidase